MRALAAAVVLAAAACGGNGDTAPQPTPAAGAPARDGGLRIAEAKASALDGPLLVSGYVIAGGREFRLCEAILESEPPQCGEPSLRIEHADDAELRAMFERRERVSLLGEVEAGAIVVVETAQG